VVITAAAFGLLAVAGASLDLVQILLVILVTQVVLTVATLPPVRTYYAVRPAHDLPFRQLVQEGLPFLGFDLGNFVLARSDIWIAAAVLVTASERAGYGAASTLASQLVLPMVIPMLVASPIVRSLWVERRTAELTNLVRGVASLASIVALVAFGLLAVFGSQVLGFIYGAEFSSASGWLAILMVGSFVVVYTGASGHVHIMCVGPRQACAVNLLWAAIGVVAMWTGASLWGATGLAVTSTATIAGLNITQVVLVWRQTGIMTLPTLRPGPAIRSLRGEREALNALEGATPEVPIDSR
jgi:O-antigen/teichoic acid export membrane protein